jgi:chromosome segregation ATPase
MPACSKSRSDVSLAAGTLGAIVCFAALATGCQRNGDAVRMALDARQTSWQRQMASLREQYSALNERLDHQPAAMFSSSAAQKRLRATVGGIGQSLVDVDVQMRQIAPQVEGAIAYGKDEADRALEDATARMNDYLQSLSAGLASAGKELDDLTRNEPPKTAQGE